MPAAAARARSSVATRPATRRPRPARATARPAARPARRRAPSPQRRLAMGLIPATVERVGNIADSGLMLRMTRSRAWIGVLGALLAGIVTLNVVSLTYTASSGRVAAHSEALARDNAVLRAKLTRDLSGPRIQSAAAALGLVAPGASDVEYLSAGPEYAQVAARRLETGLLTASSATAPVAPTETVVPTSTPEVPPAPAPTP
jgi:hypothetical protein